MHLPFHVGRYFSLFLWSSIVIVVVVVAVIVVVVVVVIVVNPCSSHSPFFAFLTPRSLQSYVVVVVIFLCRLCYCRSHS